MPPFGFPPPEVWRDGFSVAWLYSALADFWKPWLPADAVATLERYGYYSVGVGPGFRVIVLNTNVAYKLNFWVLLTAQRDPYHQLEWLADELRAASRAGEKCHVIGHISPADPDILPAWSHLYRRIIRSYQTTVTAEFFSHTHVDEVQISKDKNDEAFAVSYIAPSLSPWKDVNPGYKELTDLERWTTDLADANRDPDRYPGWFLQYRAAEEYGLTTLSPEQWSKAVNAMLLKDHLFTKYYRNLSGGSRVQADCDGECRQEVICNVVTADRSSSLHCDLARATYRAGVSLA
ncbi:sphingomyelin phosphodiesterase-like [Pollicipes pollicipes]|uniref:sphingomyelin phosphodiesterase-like n=1 Tax=Pollicipes pollicipes TaxID=41117 RepID=UPI00188570D1|nr:sphingomyelin phosphodiesterase-like [Pollicipes pollicipes]